jgi:hypothetical protein
MKPTIVGLFTGLLLGIVLVFGSFLDMLAVAFCGAVGFVVMKIVEGEIDINEYVGANRRRR